jgi:hypothetical protein
VINLLVANKKPKEKLPFVTDFKLDEIGKEKIEKQYPVSSLPIFDSRSSKGNIYRL